MPDVLLISYEYIKKRYDAYLATQRKADLVEVLENPKKFQINNTDAMTIAVDGPNQFEVELGIMRDGQRKMEEKLCKLIDRLDNRLANVEETNLRFIQRMDTEIKTNNNLTQNGL